MKNKIMIAFVLVLLVLPLASSQLTDLGTFKQSEDISLIQLCSNCTFNNITSVTSPNSTAVVANIQMSRDGTEYNYTLLRNNTVGIQGLGIYNVNGFGDINGIETVWAYTFTVTKTGTDLKTGESLIFILLTSAMFFFLMVSLWFAIAIPYSNEINNKGAVIKVTKLKYVKLFFISLSYVFLIWFLNMLIGLSDNFVSLTLFVGFMGFLFQVLNFLAWPFIIFILVLSIFEIIKDANFNKNIKLLMEAMN